MELTLREMKSELVQIPGFVRFAVAIVGDEVTITVYRRAPWGKLAVTGYEVQPLLKELVEMGRYRRILRGEVR